MKRWRAESRGLWIIYIPKNRIKIDDYPAIRDWLLPFKARLEKRATKQNWFELQQPQDRYKSGFLGGGIVYPDISQGPKFCNSGEGFLYDCTAFIITGADRFLESILNTKLAWFLLMSLSNPLRGGVWRLRMKAQYVEPLPIPNASDLQKAELSNLAEAIQIATAKLYDVQQAITRRIPDVATDPANAKLTGKLKEWWNLPDFAAFQKELEKALKARIPLHERNDWENWITTSRAKIHALTAEIARLEAEINAMVYALFNLTPEEIVLLEESL